jgi:hypothetical protein
MEARIDGPDACSPWVSPPFAAALGWRELIGVTCAVGVLAGVEALGAAGLAGGAAGRGCGRGVTAAGRTGEACAGPVVCSLAGAVDAADGGGADDAEDAGAVSSRLRMLEGWRYRLEGEGMVSCPRVA